MQNPAWVALLRHIPAEQHNQFMLVTSAGIEIAVQSLLRIEQEFVALKGRLSGSQDAGRVFFVPYQNINYFGTTNPVKDTDFNDTFGSLILPEAVCPVAPSAAAAAQAEPGLLAGAPPRADAPRPMIRSEVLDRYRSRPSSSAILPNGRPNGAS
jgi:hypothetical protein